MKIKLNETQETDLDVAVFINKASAYQQALRSFIEGLEQAEKNNEHIHVSEFKSAIHDLYEASKAQDTQVEVLHFLVSEMK